MISFPGDLVSALRSARHAVVFTGDCDLLFSVGTSAWVQPAASIPVEAKRAGAIVVQVNPNPTPLDALADFNLQGPAAVVLPKLVEATFRTA